MIDRERRFKLLYVKMSSVVDCLAMNALHPGDVINKVCVDLEEDAEVISTLYDEHRGMFCVTLAHESWPIVPDCEYPPTIQTRNSVIRIRPDVGGNGQVVRQRDAYVSKLTGVPVPTLTINYPAGTMEVRSQDGTLLARSHTMLKGDSYCRILEAEMKEITGGSFDRVENPYTVKIAMDFAEVQPIKDDIKNIIDDKRFCVRGTVSGRMTGCDQVSRIESDTLGSSDYQEALKRINETLPMPKSFGDLYGLPYRLEDRKIHFEEIPHKPLPELPTDTEAPPETWRDRKPLF